MLLQYHEPAKFRTGNVVYEKFYHAKDANTLELLRELTAKRRVLEDALNGSSRLSEAIAREVHGGVSERSLQDLQKVQKYLPILENLIEYAVPVQQSERMSFWRRTLKIEWTSPLSWGSSHGNAWGGARFHGCDDLRFEYAMVLAVYAALLRECAMEEADADPKGAIRRLQEAAGVYEYAEKQVLEPLKAVLPNANNRPVETAPSMAEAWKQICLGEAQAIAVQLAEQSGKSPRLLASLHKGCLDKYEEAINILRSNGKEWSELSEKFVRYLHVSKALHELKMRRWLAKNAVDTEENGVGVALVLLRAAKARLQEVKIPGDAEWRATYAKEEEAFQKQLQTITYDNDNIYRHKEPHEAEIPIPEGASIAEALPYKKSTPIREFVFVP